MSLMKRHLEKLIEKGKICPYCWNADCKNYDECGRQKYAEEQNNIIGEYLNR